LELLLLDFVVVCQLLYELALHPVPMDAQALDKRVYPESIEPAALPSVAGDSPCLRMSLI